MKILIITVAGMALRFNQSLKENMGIIKCLYNEDEMKNSLLCRLLSNFYRFDQYIIVGGYKFDILKNSIERESCFDEFRERIVLVNNEKYEEYGSGYSLYKGLKEACKNDFDEIVFAEGDLYIDQKSCERIIASNENVLTINREAIYANKAVVVYLDRNEMTHYVYDTQHGALKIDEPFVAIFNSGQVWKLKDVKKIRKMINELTEREFQGTNLVYIEKYFGSLNKDEYEIVEFEDWINCNTINDYIKIKELEEAYENNK